MKLFLSLLFVSLQTLGFSQAIEIRAGHSIIPADYVSVRYESYTNGSIHFSAKAFLEGSTKNKLSYSAYGLDIMAEYYSDLGYNTDHKFELKACLGGTVQIENEPWIYKGLSASRRMNYGFVGEAVAEWAMTDEFSLTGFAQQKYLFNSTLGHTVFTYGIGIKIKFTE